MSHACIYWSGGVSPRLDAAEGGSPNPQGKEAGLICISFSPFFFGEWGELPSFGAKVRDEVADSQFPFSSTNIPLLFF